MFRDSTRFRARMLTLMPQNVHTIVARFPPYKSYPTQGSLPFPFSAKESFTRFCPPLPPQVNEHAREPCLKPTVPPPDQDARWIYSPVGRVQNGVARLAEAVPGPTGPLSAFAPEAANMNARSPERVGTRHSGGRGTDGGGGERESATCDIEENDTLDIAGPPTTGSRVTGGACTAKRQPPAKITQRCERSMRRRDSTGEARERIKKSVSQNAVRVGGAGGRGRGYDGLSRGEPRSPVPATKNRQTASEFGVSDGVGLDPSVPAASSLGTHSSPPVSPWCRYSAWSPGLGSPAGGMFLDRGLMGWTEDGSEHNVG